MNALLIIAGLLAFSGLASAQSVDLTPIAKEFNDELEALLGINDAEEEPISANVTNLIASINDLLNSEEKDLTNASIAVSVQVSYMGTEMIETAARSGDGTHVWDALKLLQIYTCDFLEAAQQSTKDVNKKTALFIVDILCEQHTFEQIAVSTKYRVMQVFPADAPFSPMYLALDVTVAAAKALVHATANSAAELKRDMQNAYNSFINLIALWPPSKVVPEIIEALNVMNQQFCAIAQLGSAQAVNIHGKMAFDSFLNHC